MKTSIMYQAVFSGLIKKGFRVSWISILLLMLMLLTNGIAAVEASPSIDDLPSRPPLKIPTKIKGHIQLEMTDYQANHFDLWTVVQWQDLEGEWHDTEGWQGKFDADGRVLWTVGLEHAGDVAFRWLVYNDSSRSDMLVMSKEFDLPGSDQRLVIVPIAVQNGKTSVTEAKLLPEDAKGGMIRLTREASASASNYWTSVQWLNEKTGTWEIVDGWKGHFDTNGQVEWFVDSDSLGKGPFRWVVTSSEESSTVVATSSQFTMPSQRGNVVDVTVSVSK